MNYLALKCTKVNFFDVFGTFLVDKELFGGYFGEKRGGREIKAEG